VTRSVDFERLWSGIEELGLLMELVNFQVEIPTSKCSNSTINVDFSSPLQGKTSESHNSPTTQINLELIGKIGFQSSMFQKNSLCKIHFPISSSTIY
jgi:hypothetical protein